ncbi:hypothetical protein HXX76_007718 [Chlamydomonas incerta]|uniref:Uncharacterized protein n=1 Tax=Chlamydomonas incerta TaxID=51695 RepID=A0A835W2G4_CHLIN|nr:hypothetical protein HXX76_007718 [Chlamydomonas incerta]|eukprot:KAG2434833.1 hypothetical protein HXX76_007718 [Chlamydomonas incerta]
MSEVPVGSQFTTDTGVPTYVPTQARLLAVSYNVAKSVGVENDAVTTTVEGAFVTTVYSVSGGAARRLLDELVVQQDAAEQEEAQRLAQAEQQLQALVQPHGHDHHRQLQARSRALLQTAPPPPPRACLNCSSIVESALAAGLCIGLKLSNCSLLTVSCLNESALGATTFPAIPVDAAQAALANSCNAALLASFAMPNTSATQQAAMAQAIISTPIIAPGFGVVPPPASASSVAPSALLRTVVVNTGKPNPGSNSSDAAFAISGAMVAESVAATFGLPPDQVVLVTDPNSPPSGGETAPAPAPGSIPTPNLGPDGSPSPPSDSCTENPKFGSLCGAAAVGAIVGVAVGGTLVVGLAALMIFSAATRRRQPVSPMSSGMYGDRSTMLYSPSAWPPAPGPTTVAAVPGPWSALGPGASLGAAAARSAGGAAPGAPSAPWHDRDVAVGAAAAAAAAAAGAVLTKSPAGGPARASQYYSGGGIAPRWSSAGGAYGVSGGGGVNASFLDINQVPPPGVVLGGNPVFYDLAGNPILAPGVDPAAAEAMAAAAAAGYGGGGSAGGAGASPSRLRPPSLIIPPQGAGMYAGGPNTLGSIASPAPASAGPAYGYRLGTGVGSPGVYSKYPGRGPQSLAGAAAASPASMAAAARYSSRAAGYSNGVSASMAALQSSMAADSAAAEELRRSRGAATMAGLASAAYSSHPYVGRTGAPPAASSLGGAGGEPLPRYYAQPQQAARPSPLGAGAAPVRGSYDSLRGSYGQPSHYGLGGLGSPAGVVLPGAFGKTGPAGPLPSPGGGRPANSLLGAGGVAVPMGLYGEPSVQQTYSPGAPGTAPPYMYSPGGSVGGGFSAAGPYPGPY